MNEPTNAYRDVLEDLASSRGYSSADALASRVVATNPHFGVREILEAPPGGFGTAIDRVVALREVERRRLADAFRRTFL